MEHGHGAEVGTTAATDAELGVISERVQSTTLGGMSLEDRRPRVSLTAATFTKTTIDQMSVLLESKEDMIHYGQEVFLFLKKQLSVWYYDRDLSDLLFPTLSDEDSGNMDCDEDSFGVNPGEGEKLAEIQGEVQYQDEMICEGEKLAENQGASFWVSVLRKLGIYSGSWTSNCDGSNSNLDPQIGLQDPKLHELYLRVFSQVILPSSNPHPLFHSVKKLLVDLSLDFSIAARTFESLKIFHHNLPAAIDYPQDQGRFISSIQTQILQSMENEVLKYTVADSSVPNFRLGDCILLSVKVNTPQPQIPVIKVPLSFPVILKGKTIVLQTIGAVYKNQKSILRRIVCRSAFHCGGYYFRQQVDDMQHSIHTLDPSKIYNEGVFRSFVTVSRITYFLTELFFVETLSQSFTTAGQMLQEEVVFECPSLSVVKGDGLRKIMNKSEYMETNVLEALCQIMRERIKPFASEGRNIILPAQFFEVLKLVPSLAELNNCAECFQLSKDDWSDNTIAHLFLSHPSEHWQYCTLVFREKRVYYSDSLLSYSTEANIKQRNATIDKLVSFIFQVRGSDKGVWEHLDSIVPQQTETLKHFCGTYAVVNFVRGIAEGLSSSESFEVPTWDSNSLAEGVVTTFPTPILICLKQLLVGVILAQIDIFDIFFLLLPYDSLSITQKTSCDRVVGRDRVVDRDLPVDEGLLKWPNPKKGKPAEVIMKSLNIGSHKDITFFAGLH